MGKSVTATVLALLHKSAPAMKALIQASHARRVCRKTMDQIVRNARLHRTQVEKCAQGMANVMVLAPRLEVGSASVMSVGILHPMETSALHVQKDMDLRANVIHLLALQSASMVNAQSQTNALVIMVGPVQRATLRAAQICHQGTLNALGMVSVPHQTNALAIKGSKARHARYPRQTAVQQMSVLKTTNTALHAANMISQIHADARIQATIASHVTVGPYQGLGSRGAVAIATAKQVRMLLPLLCLLWRDHYRF